MDDGRAWGAWQGACEGGMPPSTWRQASVAANRRFAWEVGCNYSVYKVTANVVRLSRNNFSIGFICSHFADSSLRTRSSDTITSSVPPSPGTPLPAIYRPSRRNRIAVDACRMRSHIARFSSSFMNTPCETSSAVRPHPLQTLSNNVEHTLTQGLSGKS